MLKNRFTLIELLAVIAIIGLLAAIVIPVVASSQLRGKITQAKTDMRTIETALDSLASAHGGKYMTSTAGRKGNTYSWGGQSMGTGSPIKVSGDKTKYLIGELCDPDSVTCNNNLRKTRFLDPSKDYKGTLSTEGCWPDPWGNAYTIWICTDGTQKMQPHSGHDVYKNVIIWSYGPDGENQNGGNAEADNCLKNKQADDVASWHK